MLFVYGFALCNLSINKIYNHYYLLLFIKIIEIANITDVK